MSHPTTAFWTPLGTMSYQKALELQERFRDDLLQETSHVQTVFSVEHPPTITIGRSGTFAHIVAPRERLEEIGMAVYEVDRGGDVTYHGPGQLVLYPILHLSPWGNDVGRYVRSLEESVIQALKTVGIEGSRVEGFPGVWVGEEKVCAIGVRMRRRPSGEYVTSHGLALNVTTDLSHFETIVPCGITDRGVASVQKILQQPQRMTEWLLTMKQAFANVFEVEFVDANCDGETEPLTSFKA